MPPIFQLGPSRQHLRSLVKLLIEEKNFGGQNDRELGNDSSFHEAYELTLSADLEDLGFRADIVEEALETSGHDVDKTVELLLNNRDILRTGPSQAQPDLLQTNVLATSYRSRSNKFHTEQITCLYPDCPRSRIGNGYPHHLDQLMHINELHGWSNVRDILKGLSVDGDDFIRDRSGKILATARWLQFTNSPVAHRVGESGQIRDSRGTLLGMALYEPETVRLLESSKEQPLDTSNSASPKIPSDRRNEDQEQRMYMHYTISRDMTGSNNEVATKLLAALGERSRETRFKNADLTVLGSKK